MIPVPPEILSLCVSCDHVGSRVTCSPIPEYSDDDWLLFTQDPTAVRDLALALGFVVGGSMNAEIENCGFFSLTRPNDPTRLNLIVTPSRDFQKKFLVATILATRLNVLEKKDRIALFQAVLYNNTA